MNAGKGSGGKDLWEKLSRTVEPIGARRRAPRSDSGQNDPTPSEIDFSAPVSPAKRQRGAGSDFDKRLAKGAIVPDCSIDLHGHTLDAAWQRLMDALARAQGSRKRVLLVVTGKPASDPGSLRAPGGAADRRGMIAAKLEDWIAASRFAGSVRTICGAHPRHGGAGARYVIFRKPR